MEHTKDIPQWDLSPIFSSFQGEDYKKAIEDYKAGLQTLEKKLKDSEAQKKDFSAWLADYLTESDKIDSLRETIGAYTYATYSTDTTNSEYLNNLSKFEEISLQSQSQAVIFQQILRTYSQELSLFFTTFPQFKSYSYVLNHFMEDGKHRMSPEQEELASDMERTGGAAWSRLHEQIISNLSDKETGKTFNEIRNDAYNPDPQVRKTAWEKEIAMLKSMEIPIAASLNNLKGATVTLNKRRNWKKAIHRSLASAHITEKTLNSLIAAMEESLPMWREYLQIKGEILRKAGTTCSTDTKGCAFYDLFAPLTDTTPETSPQTEHKVKMEGWTFQEARDYIIQRFSSFSQDMGNFAKTAFDNNWIDAKVRKGKVGGAYCIDFPAKRVSRVLSNFTGSFSDVTTLAHELGHAYHHHCIAHMDYSLTHYPMTLAETASIFAETIVMKDILSVAEGFDKIKLIEMHLQDSCQVIVDILSRFYFERSVFEKREQQELSAQDFCELMKAAQENSYGEGLSSERHEYMWAVKSHYYSTNLDFYNFPYAFGLLFALGLYAKYQQEGANFPETYKTILQDTGSLSCEDVCKKAGFDIETKDFWLSGIKTFMPELQELKAWAHR